MITHDVQYDLFRPIVLDLLHPHRADLLLILSQNLRQRLSSLGILLKQIESIAFVGFTWDGFGR